MTNTSARDAIYSASVAEGWTMFGTSDEFHRFVRGDVTINVTFTGTGAVRTAVRNLPDVIEYAGTRGKRETVLQWLRRPADVDAPLDLVQRVLDGPVAQPAMGLAALVWCDTHHEDGAHRLIAECVNGHFTGQYGAVPAAIGTQVHEHAEAMASQAAQEAVNLLGIWATGSAAGDPATRAAQDEIMNRLGSLEAGLAAADRRAAELERKLAHADFVVLELRDDKVQLRRQLERATTMDPRVGQADEDGAIVEGLVAVIGRLEARVAHLQRVAEHGDRVAEDLVAVAALPTACTSCGAGYDECTEAVRAAGGRACCGTCGYRVTHGQNQWEHAHRSRTVAEVIGAHPDTATEALELEGIVVPRHLAEEVPNVTEPAMAVGTTGRRVFGVLDHGELRHVAGRHGQVVPVDLVGAYVAGVRELGFPAPTSRRALLVDLKARKDLAR